MALLADENDLIARYSPDLIGDLLTDRPGNPILAADFATDLKLQSVLMSATGQAKAALRQAQRYSDEQLEAIMDPGSTLYDQESSEYLKTIVCQIAFWLLYQRKPWNDGNEAGRRQAEAGYKESLEWLRTGAHILNFDTAADAGVAGATRGTNSTSWSRQPKGRFYPRNNGDCNCGFDSGFYS